MQQNNSTYHLRSKLFRELLAESLAVVDAPTKPNLKRLRDVCSRCETLANRGRGRPQKITASAATSAEK